MKFDIVRGERFEVNTIAMARGEHVVEEVDDGEVVAFVIVWGCIQVTRERGGQPASYCLHARPSAPLFLVNPGRYCVVAERNSLGVRGVRRKGVIV